MGQELIASSAEVPPSFGAPHTLVLFLVAVCCLVVALLAPGSKREIWWQRRVYWGGTFGAALSAFGATLPNIATGAILAGLAVFVMVLPAYFSSQYIKIGQRVIAFHSPVRSPGSVGLRDDRPYGVGVSAAKMWWLLVVCSVMAMVNVYAFIFDDGSPVLGVLGLIALVVIGALVGIGDGMAGQRVARGQYFPFIVGALISGGTLALAYLITRAIALGSTGASR